MQLTKLSQTPILCDIRKHEDRKDCPETIIVL